MLALQVVACGITLAAAWMIGNKWIAGPALNAVAALCFAVLNAYADLWVCAAFSVAMAAVNVRNCIRWHSAAAGLAAIAVLALALSPPAEARPHRHHRHHVARSDPIKSQSLFGAGGDVVSMARSQIGNGAIYGRATLWCARFMNVVLERVGYHGTGSDMAASFAKLPRTSLHVGAIAVMGRRGGGHVGIVSGIDANGNPIIISGNHGNRVQEAPYPARRIYAYVDPQ